MALRRRPTCSASRVANRRRTGLSSRSTTGQGTPDDWPPQPDWDTTNNPVAKYSYFVKMGAAVCAGSVYRLPQVHSTQQIVRYKLLYIKDLYHKSLVGAPWDRPSGTPQVHIHHPYRSRRLRRAGPGYPARTTVTFTWLHLPWEQVNVPV